MRVVIYNRVSTDDKDQDPKSNLERCRTYCDLNDHEVVEVLLDEGISGDTFYYERSKGKILQDMINKGKVEGIVVYCIDRFSRQNPMKILPILNNFKNRGITFISVTEPVFNMEGEFADPMRYMLTWFSNYFLKQHKNKVNAGIENAKKHGTKSGKPIGRERKNNYDEIIKLHEQGISMSQIAKQLSCSKGSVHYAISSFKRKSF